MDAADELLTIAEIAIGLAGFSGVVVAFTRREGLRTDDRYYFVALVCTAFTAVLLAFVPAILYRGGLSEPALWNASSATMVVVWLILNVTMLIRARNITWNPVGVWFGGTQFALTFATLLSQIANLTGWPLESGSAMYLVGLMLWLASAGMVFALLVLVGMQD